MNSSDGGSDSRRLLPYVLCVVPFLLLCTLNSAGYRYGASDQAFYAPAMFEAIDPELYPRDSDVIHSQAQLTLADNLIGPVARATGIDLPALFVVLQIAALSLLALAVLLVAAVFYRTAWAGIALLAAVTLRHAISKSGTNTLEGYFHPRQLSFALGALAVALFLRGRYAATVLLVAAAGAFHPTTGLWFAIWLGVALVVHERRDRRVWMLAGIAVAGAAAFSVWAFTSGPLTGRFVFMDSEWLATLSSKPYLFPLEWPAATWLINLGYIPVIVLLFRRRQRAGLTAVREAALVAGGVALAVVFLIALPFNAARVALAIQLQPARVFWMLDFLAVVYVVWLLAEGVAAQPTRARAVAILLVAVSIVRGGYVMVVEFPERRIAQANISNDDWGQAMAWARTTDKRSGWLADPDHAARYGTSIRVAARRDVFVEAIKDGAVGMYERGVALRTRDRVRALGDFMTLTPERARALAAAYDLDYLITEQPIALPEVFRSGSIGVYRLR
ncbi:MAG TPA: hypothetical protein VFJ02_12895 [Vicinamibacterales bacterium]|nr:hypothetical protein [Vicinamibacterales bacterium]